MIDPTGSDATRYSSAGTELPRHIRFQELARYFVHAGDIELVRHIQYFLRTEASSCGK
jgi:hypothetical protein